MDDLTSSSSQGVDDPKGTPQLQRNLAQWLIEPADGVIGSEARREARLLAASLAVLVPFTAMGAIATIVFAVGRGELSPNVLVLLASTIALIIAYALSRTVQYRWGAYVAVGVLVVVPYAALLVAGGLDPEALIWIPLTLVVSSVFLSFRGVVVVIALNLLILFLLPVVIPGATLVDILGELGLTAALGGALLVGMRFRDLQERGRQAELYERNRELEEARAMLEQRVDERTGALMRRADYLEATSAVAREAASVLEVEELLGAVARLVSERFGFYHTGIFLLDADGEWAVLQAASSEGGQRMLERGHQLRLGLGIVGNVVALGEYRIALDVGEDAAYFDNPDLPETRSEMALPLRVRGQVIGALDVQSREPGAFSDEDVAVLQTLADQVALAINNAQLLQQAQESLEAERHAYGELRQSAWVEMIRSRQRVGYRYHEHEIESVSDDGGSVEAGSENLPLLSLPVKYRDAVFGTIEARKPADAGQWTNDEIELMETLAEQLSLALDSARLHEETQQRASREQLLGEVTGRIRETLDVEAVLRATAQEVRRALDLPEVVVRLAPPQTGEDSHDVESSLP